MKYLLCACVSDAAEIWQLQAGSHKMRGPDSAETTFIHVPAATGCSMAAGKSQLWDQARHIRVEARNKNTAES